MYAPTFMTGAWDMSDCYKFAFAFNPRWLLTQWYPIAYQRKYCVQVSNISATSTFTFLWIPGAKTRQHQCLQTSLTAVVVRWTLFNLANTEMLRQALRISNPMILYTQMGTLHEKVPWEIKVMVPIPLVEVVRATSIEMASQDPQLATMKSFLKLQHGQSKQNLSTLGVEVLAIWSSLAKRRRIMRVLKTKLRTFCTLAKRTHRRRLLIQNMPQVNHVAMHSLSRSEVNTALSASQTCIFPEYLGSTRQAMATKSSVHFKLSTWLAS